MAGDHRVNAALEGFYDANAAFTVEAIKGGGSCPLLHLACNQLKTRLWFFVMDEPVFRKGNHHAFS